MSRLLRGDPRHPSSQDALLLAAHVVTHFVRTWRDAAAARPTAEQLVALVALRQALVNASDVDAART
ncbi:hypothetical protein ACGF5O_37880 [Streptomyces sp. NPDC048291]|uniref:hypothetical protein n=1 Tax=Streptomyces sp. NPDC048291 TaxID=3365530 RepID=UPI003717392E